MAITPDLKLGLIGGNIAQSKSPYLHRFAGAQNGLAVEYDLLVPKAIGKEFGAVLDDCAVGGYRGVNVTYPYKELAAEKVHITDPLVRAIGAINTVVFETDGVKGFSTDYSGFLAAYRAVRGARSPGAVCLIGTGGVGRALAFALVALGAEEIRLVDKNLAKAEALARALETVPNAPAVRAFADTANAAYGATGLLNGTPVGMVGYGGTPLPTELVRGAKWAFDAVYTPLETKFMQDCASLGLDVISGYELFFYQGVHAWSHFSSLPVDEVALRASLSGVAEAA